MPHGWCEMSHVLIRAQLEVKTSLVAPPTSGEQTTPTQSKSDDIIRITQLEDQLERSQDQCRSLEKQVTQLKHSLHCLEKESRGSHQSAGQPPQSRLDGGLTAEEVKVQQEKHEVHTQQISTNPLDLPLSPLQKEVSSLRKKLQWYSENQKLVDFDLVQLREKDTEIARLNERLAAAQVSL